MSSEFNKTVRDFAKALQDVSGSKTIPYDTQAVVKRVDGNTAWVHIEGGIDETPVMLTTNAKKGDIVQVRVSGGNAWLYGNATAPPTDDTKANEADKKAMVADEHATNAYSSAALAKQYAEEARIEAGSATTAANLAWDKAESAERAAVAADTHAARAEADAAAAASNASAAQTSATNAYNSASLAISQLGVVEDIVGVLEFVSQHGVYTATQDKAPTTDKWYFRQTGTVADPRYEVVNQPLPTDYILTQDTVVITGKTYYTRSGTSPNYTYSAVETPVDADIATYYEYTNSPALHGFYELTDVDSSIQNYVSSHLALVGNSIYLQNGNTRVEVSTTEGLTLRNASGAVIANYGKNTTLGNLSTYGIKIGEGPEYVKTKDISIDSTKTYYTRSGTSPNYTYTQVENPVVADIATYYERPYEIGFYQGGKRVAYINGDKLYITQSVVLQQMDVGNPEADGGLGQWSWKVHEVNNRNNLYLKWLG